jgi:hypothetical protein
MLTAYLMLTILAGADVSCAEATHDWREIDAVLQVARNRSIEREQPLLHILTARRQFASKCPTRRLRLRHYGAGLRMLTGDLEVPAWLKDPQVQFFCTQGVAWKWKSRERWARNIRPVGRLRHLYWRLRS